MAMTAEDLKRKTAQALADRVAMFNKFANQSNASAIPRQPVASTEKKAPPTITHREPPAQTPLCEIRSAALTGT